MWYAVELRHCSELREVAFENNRLATPVLDLRCLSHLRALQLFGNPLEFLPELSPCTALRYLSLANVRNIGQRCTTSMELWNCDLCLGVRGRDEALSAVSELSPCSRLAASC